MWYHITMHIYCDKPYTDIIQKDEERQINRFAILKGALCVCDREIYHTINSTIQSIE